MKNTFCSSPWFHLKIDRDGSYFPCRWFPVREIKNRVNMRDMSIMEYWNSQEMRDMRMSMTSGDSFPSCVYCCQQDQYGKLNGRKRQLAKSGVFLDDFDRTLAASPHLTDFLHSHKNNGVTPKSPSDLQINLGSICNSACVMCWPRASTRLQQDHNRLHNENPDLFEFSSGHHNWISDRQLFTQFLNDLLQLDDLKYLHLLGGETLYMKEFYEISETLIDCGLSKDIILGTTTNGTIYDERVENLIPKFKEIHLGISIETFSEINDYVRYPGKITHIRDNIIKFVRLRDQMKAGKLFITLRITPSILTVRDLYTVFDFADQYGIITEDCHILNNPKFLKVEYLPDHLKGQVLQSLIVDDTQADEIVNVRNSDNIPKTNNQSKLHYRKFLQLCSTPDDVDKEMLNLVRYLKSLEGIRSNTLWDVNAELAEWLKSYGY